MIKINKNNYSIEEKKGTASGFEYIQNIIKRNQVLFEKMMSQAGFDMKEIEKRVQARKKQIGLIN